MAHYVMKCKEVGREHLLTSSIIGEEKTKEELIAFWGLDEPDVESYELFEVIEGKEVKL